LAWIWIAKFSYKTSTPLLILFIIISSEKEKKSLMANFKSVFLLLVILAAGGILLAVGETTGPAEDNDLLPTVQNQGDRERKRGRG